MSLQHQQVIHPATLDVLRQTNHVYSKLVVCVTEGTYIIDPKDILYCKASGNYTHIRLDSGKEIICSKTLKCITAGLNEQQFVRVHKSHLINISKMIFFSRIHVELEDGSKLAISRSKRSVLMGYAKSIQ